MPVGQNRPRIRWLGCTTFIFSTKIAVSSPAATARFWKRKDGGKSWTKRKNFTADNILQISFSDEYNGWLLCERDVFSRGANNISYLLKTSDGGESWEKVEFKDAGRARITKIFFNRKDKGFAVGESGAFFELKDDGTWEKTPSANRYLLLGGTFADDTHGAIVGAGGNIFFTEDAGASWNQSNIFGDKTAKFNSVFFTNQKNGWTVGANGKIFQTFSGGKTWREQNSGVTNDLFDVFFKNTAQGWAVGDGGTILHTETAGNVWTVQQTPLKHKLERVLFVGKKGFAVGFGGTILVYDEADFKK